MVSYAEMYHPMMYVCKYRWSDEHIAIKAKITRNEQTLFLDFLLSGTDYDKFVCMVGAFRGFDSNGKETIIKLLDTDIITIIESDYSVVKNDYDKKCADDYKLYLEHEKARREEHERNRTEKEKTKEPEKEKVKEPEAEMCSRRGFWYRLFHRNK